ncbi:TonB-dependent receptor [Flavivirga spongiicola]|uniref:TonB-dependent receptor n=1 Tax=Flavivirga spongiicola TaxID=421621 RepID=A0ABU7XMU9_9FLAO|nr:TonB-dependent receptor [Flavivirga sp. MEBiC05379]MDO5981427.1 TonB-dependent receptor [Flavivirga sp. MEBiC05379]
MNKKFSIVLALLLSFSYSFTQTGSVKGSITDNTQMPLSGVNILIKNSIKGVQSNENGTFEISNISNGNHTLVISYIGFKTREILFSISNNQTNTLGTIILYEGNELLSEVIVQGERKNKFSRKKTAYVSKLPLKDLENSQVYSTVTSELLESQVVTNFDDGIKNATGVSKLWEATGRGGDGTGYYTLRGFSIQPSLIDGVPGSVFSSVDPSYIERIEVLKGPSATLFGSTVNSLGGLINVVTKKPFEGFGGSVSYTGGSFDSHRVSVDLNTPLGDKNSPYFRINSSYLTQGSFQDAGFRKTFFIAPSLSYRVNNRLNISAGIEFSKTRQTNPAMLFVRRGYPIKGTTPAEFGINPEASFTNNDIYLENPVFNTRLIADYKISDSWTSQTIFSSSSYKSEGYYSYLLEGASRFFLRPLPDPSDPTYPFIVGSNQFFEGLLENDLITRLMIKQDSGQESLNVQQNFIGDFKIGNVRNRSVIGFDYVKNEAYDRNKDSDPNTGFPIVNGFFLPDGTLIDNPLTQGEIETAYPHSPTFFDPIFENLPANDIETKSQTMAIYASDVINFSPALSIMLGLRLDYFNQDGEKSVKEDDYTKTSFSPKFGAVYQPILNKMAVFVNYQTGFINVNPKISVDFNTGNTIIETLPPTKSTQYEIGTKTNFLNGKLNIGISYYNITAKDKRDTDPVNGSTSINIDEIISQGIELEVNANPFDGLNLRIGYAYNDSEITKTVAEGLLGRRPIESGAENTYTVWGDYKFQEDTFLKNMGIGAGLNGASEYFTINNSTSGQFKLPSYTIYNASIYYDTPKFRIGIKANNITDEVYYKGWSTLVAQQPRAFLANAVYKF